MNVMKIIQSWLRWYGASDKRRLVRCIRPYTLLSEQKIWNLIDLADDIEKSGISGDYVECGTCRGGSAALLGGRITNQRHMWLYDSFEGLPDVTNRDGDGAKEYVGKCVGSVSDVETVMARVGIAKSAYTIRKGYFSDTYQEPLPETVAFLHCDADWYESVLLTLETFYPLVVDGGCIVLDDFGCWEGCREAFYDFCSSHNEKPLLGRSDYDQAFWIKGKAHNRF